MTVTALIVAAGSGSRMGGDVPKQYRLLGGKAVLAHAVDGFLTHPRIDAVRIVIGTGQDELARAALVARDVGEFIIGGSTRSESVRNGIAAIDDGLVLIHDAARPFCPPEVIDRLLAALEDAPGAVPALPNADTLVVRNGENLGETVDREAIARVQTPQAFHRAALLDAYAAWTGDAPTDETQVLRAHGGVVTLVEGDARLHKLTTDDDWAQAEQALAARMVSRTGMGFDVHGFAGEGPVMLGGIAIEHEKGLSGHSDADVLLHAITDALLGTAGLGDIGAHFPPSDPQWKGANSEMFLAHAATLVRDKGGIIDHVDATLICEEPKVGPHRETIRVNISRILAISIDQVSVKATTTERMGFTGRREGIACQAICTARLPL